MCPPTKPGGSAHRRHLTAVGSDTAMLVGLRTLVHAHNECVAHRSAGRRPRGATDVQPIAAVRGLGHGSRWTYCFALIPACPTPLSATRSMRAGWQMMQTRQSAAFATGLG
jgi:hypothetical protein